MLFTRIAVTAFRSRTLSPISSTHRKESTIFVENRLIKTLTLSSFLASEWFVASTWMPRFLCLRYRRQQHLIRLIAKASCCRWRWRWRSLLKFYKSCFFLFKVALPKQVRVEMILDDCSHHGNLKSGKRRRRRLNRSGNAESKDNFKNDVSKLIWSLFHDAFKYLFFDLNWGGKK